MIDFINAHIKHTHTHFCLKTGAKSFLIRHSATSLHLALCLLQQAKLCSYCIPDAKKQIRQNKNEDTAHVPAKKAWAGGRSTSFLKTLGFLQFVNKTISYFGPSLPTALFLLPLLKLPKISFFLKKEQETKHQDKKKNFNGASTIKDDCCKQKHGPWLPHQIFQSSLNLHFFHEISLLFNVDNKFKFTTLYEPNKTHLLTGFSP